MSEARRGSPRSQAPVVHPPPAPSPTKRGTKRKAESDSTAISNSRSSSVEILDGPPEPKKTTKTVNRLPSLEILDAPPSKKLKGPPSPEKRLRMFRAAPPQSFYAVFERARSQRFYVLSRRRVGTPDCPEEDVELTGSTGNIYTVHVGPISTCTCPHNMSGNQCKHILYVLSRVLRADFKYVYQLALLSSELKEILAGAPPIDAGPASTGSDAEEAGKRKPIEGDCPICFCEFDPNEKETITWCRAACGQNVHTHCFRMWAATKCPGRESEATCPYCRSAWGVELDPVAVVKRTGQLNVEGYVNVAEQLGISGVRDESTYSSTRYWDRYWDRLDRAASRYGSSGRSGRRRW